MRMRHEDMRDVFPLRRIKNSLNVRGVCWAWINDGNVSGTQDVGARSVKSKRARIICDDSTNGRTDLLNRAVFEFHLTAEGDFNCHAAPMR